MTFSTSKQSNSNATWQFKMKLGNSRQGNSYENAHFQSGNFKLNLAISLCSWKIGYFHTRKFTQNLALQSGNLTCSYELGTSSLEIHAKFATSKQGMSYEIWQFEKDFGSTIKEIHMKFGTSKHLHFQSRKPLNRGIHLKLGTSIQETSYELGNFQTGNFQMKLGTFQQGSSNVHMQSGTSKQAFHMRFVMFNQGNSNVHMELGTSNQGNSYEIWHVQNEHFI